MAFTQVNDHFCNVTTNKVLCSCFLTMHAIYLQRNGHAKHALSTISLYVSNNIKNNPSKNAKVMREC